MERNKIEMRLDGIRRKWLERRDGGKGSGNWGHAGRPGQVGGSQENPEAAKWHRYTDANTKEYTSFAKVKKAAATPHQSSTKELQKLPVGSRLIDGMDVYEKIKASDHIEQTKWINTKTGEVIGSYSLNKQYLWGKDIRVAIPASAEPDIKEKVNSEGSMIGTKKAGEKKSEPYYESFSDTAESKSSSEESSSSLPFGNEPSTEPAPKPYTPPKDNFAETFDPSDNGSEKSSESSSKSAAKSDKVFSEGGYTKARVSKTPFLSKVDGYSTYAPVVSKAWKNMTPAEKHSSYRYTQGSRFINEPLNGKQYSGYKSNGQNDTSKAINELTSAIDKNVVPQDTMMCHGLSANSLENLFGINAWGNVEAQLKAKIGESYYNGGFVSCGLDKENYYAMGKSYILDIFVPKGAKGMYVEPFSAYGKSQGENWNGKYVSGDNVYGENEVILQRGSVLKLTGVKYVDGKMRVQCELVGQDPDRISQSEWEKYC